MEVTAPLGLASYFSACYWVGLALLVITSIFAFLDRELKKDAISIIILIALGLFLFGIKVFVRPNPSNPDIYYPNPWVYNLLATGHLDVAENLQMSSSYSWPAILLISASLLKITGLSLISLMKYAPLFFTLCFVFITYGIGKRFKLEPDRCFLISFLAIASLSFIFFGTFYARLPAAILFLLLFMLLLVPRRTVAESVAVILMFAALVLTHGLTAMAVLPGIVLLSIYRKDYRFVALFIVIFGIWYMFQATTAFKAGILAFASPLSDVFRIAQLEVYHVSPSTTRLVSLYSWLIQLASFAVLMVGSAILLLRRRITGERREQVIALFCWAIGVALLLFFGQPQVVFRTYVYLLVPAVCIAALSFSSRKLLILVMCLLVALSPIINNVDEAEWGQVLTSELQGTKFFALEVKPQDSYFYDYGYQLILYNDPNLATVPVVSSAAVALAKGILVVSDLNELHYVIISKQGTDSEIYSRGEDPYAVWPQTEVGKMADLIYNNGYFQIYVNRPAE